MFPCQVCEKIFTSRENLQRHIKYIHDEMSLLCEFCGEIKSNFRNLRYHHQKDHQIYVKFENEGKRKIICKEKTPSKKGKVDEKCDNSQIKCEQCGGAYEEKNRVSHLRSLEHKNKTLKFVEDDKNITIVENAFKSRIISYRVTDEPNEYTEVSDFTDAIKNKICSLLKTQIDLHNAIKVNLEVFAQYIKFDSKNGENISSIKSFNTKNQIFNAGTDFNQIYDDFVVAIKAQSEEFQEKESGWGAAKILFMEVNVNKYNPMRGSSYIPLPRKIMKKKAILNIENTDDKCFYWCIVAALNPHLKHPERPTELSKCNVSLNLNNISFPLPLRDIPIFEKNNNISINVYGLENNVVVGPLYYTNFKRNVHINLLYLEDYDSEKDEMKSHYCLIKNLSRLVSSQISKRDGKK